jgi:CBS domain-containing protein
VGPLVSERHLGVAVTSTGKTAEADTAYIDAGQTLRQAGHLMRRLGVGALEVRGDDGEVRGTITSEMVVRRIAAGGDPKTVTVGEVASAVSARRRAPARSPGNAARCAAIMDRALATIS